MSKDLGVLEVLVTSSASKLAFLKLVVQVYVDFALGVPLATVGTAGVSSRFHGLVDAGEAVEFVASAARNRVSDNIHADAARENLIDCPD